MATGNFYRGTSQTQDARFSNKDKKLLNSREWPPEFDLKVNIKKVELNAIKPWIAKKITEILGFEDEVVINLAISELESQDEKGPCPKKIQLNLTGFLSNKAGIFMRELWKLLLEAQATANGIPPSLIEERKEEIKQKKEEILNQEAKLESIRAFLKQAGEEIKSKLNKKGPNEKDDKPDRKKGNFDKIEDVLGESKEIPQSKDKDSKNNKKIDEKEHKSRSRSRSHHRKKNKDRKSKDRKKKSRSHSKDNKKEKKSLEENAKAKKEKEPTRKPKAMLSSGSSSGGSSDESSPISGASSD